MYPNTERRATRDERHGDRPSISHERPQVTPLRPVGEQLIPLRAAVCSISYSDSVAIPLALLVSSW